MMKTLFVRLATSREKETTFAERAFPYSSQFQTNQIVDEKMAEPFRDGVRAALAGPVN